MERLMSCLAPDPIAENFHQSNTRLDAALSSLNSGNTPECRQVRAATPHQMASLLSELMRVGEWLRSLPDHHGPELAQELGIYRKNVERLHELMPFIHSALLQERAHLEQERGRVEAAGEWAHRSRQTL
jgi:hypothetical protein